MVTRFALVVVLSAAFASPALARSMHVEKFTATLEVTEDGTLTVEERIRVRFKGHWNGIFRDIRYGYTHTGGVRGLLPMTLDAVEDDGGNALEYWPKKSRGHLRLKIRVPGAHNATRMVVIRYHVKGVIRAQGEGDLDYGLHDELYWNVTGNEWEIPIESAEASVRLPASVPMGSIRTTGYVGLYGGRGKGWREERQADGLLRFWTTNPLPPHSGLTIVVGFEPGHVAYPTTLDRAGWWFRANWYVFVPLAFLFLWWLVWFRGGRDSLEEHTIVPDWEAPEGMRAAELGVVIDDILDQRDLTAAILDLAVRGIFTIHEHDDNYRLKLHRDRLASTKLQSFEKKIVDSLFDEDETEIELSSLRYKFVTKLKRIRDSIMDRLVGLGYFVKRPDRVRDRWAGRTVLALIALVVIGIATKSPWPYYVVSFLCIIPMFVLARYMPRRTKKGLEALARIRGVEEYLVTAEKDRMAKLPLKTMEGLLPFAVALGVHERWAEIFGQLYEEAPEWMQSSSGRVHTGALNPWVRGMNRNVGSTMMSGPRAKTSKSSGWSGGWSGGGGFSSGGGFSGGGFGGGGGGGW